ncbi:hypothetical protein [Clostridium scatologenes]|uniref:hypothetical protein n=1 Tax=Clostridium scatologenes TaxID=1548 RepID=UPI00048A6A28|nr:hypothetical protein [Clostridium scatologenes]
MKIWQQRLIVIPIVPIIWGAFVDLKFGKIASFITRVIIVTLIGLFLSYAYERIKRRIQL